MDALISESHSGAGSLDIDVGNRSYGLGEDKFTNTGTRKITDSMSVF